MYSKIVFLLLSAFAFFDLGTADPAAKAVATICKLARENSLWFPVGKRRCITGCVGDPKNHPIVIFNQCEPIQLAPGEPEQPFYTDGFCDQLNSNARVIDYIKNTLKSKIYCVDDGLPSKGLILLVS